MNTHFVWLLCDSLRSPKDRFQQQRRVLSLQTQRQFHIHLFESLIGIRSDQRVCTSCAYSKRHAWSDVWTLFEPRALKRTALLWVFTEWSHVMQLGEWPWTVCTSLGHCLCGNDDTQKKILRSTVAFAKPVAVTCLDVCIPFDWMSLFGVFFALWI